MIYDEILIDFESATSFFFVIVTTLNPITHQPPLPTTSIIDDYIDYDVIVLILVVVLDVLVYFDLLMHDVVLI